MTDIFQEAEEDHRREQLVQGIRKGWPWALGLLLIVLAAVGFFEWRQGDSLKQRRAFSDQFVEAQKLVKDAKWVEADKKLSQLLRGAPADYRAPLHLERAAVFLGQNKPDAALAALNEAAAAADTRLLKDLALLKAGYVASELPGARREALASQLAPLIKSGGAMGLLARDIIAQKDFAAGDLAAAKKAYEFLNLQIDTPPNLRQRAQTMLALLAEVEQKSPLAAASSAAPGEPAAAPADPVKPTRSPSP